MKAYRRVTSMDRLAIKQGIDAGLPQSEIAAKLGFSPSTVCRELQRNTGKRGYRPKQAQHLADSRQEFREVPLKMTREMKKKLSLLLKRRWSPEQISERLKLEGKTSVSHEAIYQYVYEDRTDGGHLWRYLRRSHRRRKPRFPRGERRGQIPGTTSIEKRTAGANNRSRSGHWERDSMLGKQESSSVLVIVDRKSRFTKMTKLNERKSCMVTEETLAILKDLPVKSITNDRGKEFADHVELAKRIKAPIYFCHPYSSHERGTNENRIGLIRQYIPKGTDLKKVTKHMVKKIEMELNKRPMKCLDWRTPYEVLLGTNIALTT